MKRGSVRKQLSRFACAIEIWDEVGDGTLKLVHRASKPINGSCAGRILNNFNLRDIMQSIVGILIYVDIPENVIPEDVTNGDGEFILPKYEKEKKYVVRAIRRKESKALLFAQVQEFKDYTKGTTVPDWESKPSADTTTVHGSDSDKSRVEESNHKTASCCINL